MDIGARMGRHNGVMVVVPAMDLELLIMRSLVLDGEDVRHDGYIRLAKFLENCLNLALDVETLKEIVLLIYLSYQNHSQYTIAQPRRRNLWRRIRRTGISKRSQADSQATTTLSLDILKSAKSLDVSPVLYSHSLAKMERLYFADLWGPKFWWLAATQMRSKGVIDELIRHPA